MKNEIDDLKKRSQKFVQDIGLPVTRFAQHVGVTSTAIRLWWLGQMNLTNDHIRAVEEFLKKYNG